MADHRRHRRTARSGSAAGRSRSVALVVAAIGVTLALSAAGALYLTSSGADGDRSSASTAGVRAATPTSQEAAGQLQSRLLADSAGVATTHPGAIPGLGSVVLARIPRASLQVIVVAGADRDANTNIVTRWQRANPGAPWTRFGTPIAGRNGTNGWTTSHREGDLRSPIGVFSLTAAGGRLPDPGTGLPYEFSPSYYRTAAPQGLPMADAFNYVVAIDYNRMAGQPPSDPTRPQGDEVGGDIWLHVDHESPTRGCIAVTQDNLVSIIRWLTPTAHPAIVMGDAADLGLDT